MGAGCPCPRAACLQTHLSTRMRDEASGFRAGLVTPRQHAANIAQWRPLLYIFRPPGSLEYLNLRRRCMCTGLRPLCTAFLCTWYEFWTISQAGKWMLWYKRLSQSAAEWKSERSGWMQIGKGTRLGKPPPWVPRAPPVLQRCRRH